MCTYIHWHMDMHAALETMVMRPCSVGLKYTMCASVHWHIDMQAGCHSVPMALPIGRPLKLLCPCARGTHQWKVTNTQYNLKYTMCTYLQPHIDIHTTVPTMVMRRWSVELKCTMCTYLHRHIDIQAAVDTMVMRPWSVGLKYTMCTSFHHHMDMQAGCRSVPMRRWQLPSAHPWNYFADVPAVPTNARSAIHSTTWNLPCVYTCSGTSTSTELLIPWSWGHGEWNLNIPCVHASTGTSTSRHIVIVCRCATAYCHWHTLKITVPTCRSYPPMQGHQYTIKLKCTVCTYLHQHIDIHPHVDTMAMAQWSLELKYTMCRCHHGYMDMEGGGHSVPMRRWQFTWWHLYNSSGDIYINNWTLMGTLKYI